MAANWYQCIHHMAKVCCRQLAASSLLAAGLLSNANRSRSGWVSPVLTRGCPLCLWILLGPILTEFRDNPRFCNWVVKVESRGYVEPFTALHTWCLQQSSSQPLCLCLPQPTVMKVAEQLEHKKKRSLMQCGQHHNVCYWCQVAHFLQSLTHRDLLRR